MRRKTKRDNKEFVHKKLLIFAPHQDDEINIAGSLMVSFIKMGGNVFVCYATNSDYEFNADIRVNEAIKACKKIGISKDHIILLGFGDTSDSEDTHFYNSDDVTISHAMRTETYGACGIDDYSFIRDGSHAKYSRKAFDRQIYNIINEIRPDYVACTDIDEHPDHRMLSISFDFNMGKILNENPNYRPIVLKRFAYPLAYHGYPNYLSKNVCSTKRPNLGDLYKFNYDVFELDQYSWDKRIRIPNYYANARFLWDDLLYRAVGRYYSQYGLLNVTKILNGDEVFWEKRSDNLVFLAELVVSSGNYEYLRDFKTYDLADVMGVKPQMKKCGWSPSIEDEKPYIGLTWRKPVRISEIRISIDPAVDCVPKMVEIYVEDTQIYIGDFSGCKSQLIIPLNEIKADNLKLVFNKSEKTFSISELEVFESRDITVSSCFPKLSINDDLAYSTYFLEKGESVVIDAINCENSSIIVNGKTFKKGDNFVRAKDIPYRVELVNGSTKIIEDKVIIRGKNIFDIFYSILNNFYYRCGMIWARSFGFAFRVLYALKTYGFLELYKRIKNKWNNQGI